jgi:hypothetical protein
MNNTILNKRLDKSLCIQVPDAITVSSKDTHTPLYRKHIDKETPPYESPVYKSPKCT